MTSSAPHRGPVRDARRDAGQVLTALLVLVALGRLVVAVPSPRATTKPQVN